MRRIALLLVTLCGVALVHGSDTNSPASEDSGSEKKLKLVLVTNNDADYWRFARAGCNAAMKELGNVDVQFHINKSGDSAGQLGLLKKLMAGKPDGVAVCVNDVFAEVDYLNEIAGQTLLVCFDSDASPSKRACYIGTDNLAAGVQAGELIKECLPDGGEVVMFVGSKQAQNAIQRQVGIQRALAGAGIDVIGVRTDDADRTRALGNVEDTLAKHPDIGCLVGLWSYEGPLILKAVEEAGKIGKVKIVCFDDEPQTLVGVGWGAIYATVVQDPFEIGRQTVLAMDKHLRGDKAAFGEEKKIHIPTRQIKQGEVGGYLEKQGKLLSQ